MAKTSKIWALAAILFGVWQAHGAQAETLKLAIGQRGNWETSVAELGTKAGIFKKRGLDLELLYTQGAGETLQVVISGAADTAAT